MKRPLVFVLALLMIGCVVVSTAGNDQSSPLLYTEHLLYEEIGDGQEMTVSGTVMQCSLVSTGVRLFIDQISVISENNSEISLLPEQKIIITTADTEIMPGDQVILRGDFAPFSQASNPGQFDLRAWYFGQNIVCTMKNASILQIQKGDGGIQEVLYGIRRAVWQSYKQILPAKAAGTIAAISLGEKGMMESEWKTMYQEGGIAHIIAVSGLHISLIGMSLYRFLRWGCLPISVSAILSGGVTVLYALMTGFGISAARAVVMFLILLGAQVCGRKYDQITAIVIAAAVLVIPNVQVLQESSFWLSFSAILILALLIPCIQRSCRIRSSIGSRLCGSVGIWIGMLPVTLFFFYQAIPWSILVNLAVIPLMSLIMGTGLLAAAAGFFSSTAGIFLGAPVQYLLKFFDFLCEVQQKLPQAVWVAGKPGWLQTIIYYGGLLLIVFATGRHRQSYTGVISKIHASSFGRRMNILPFGRMRDVKDKGKKHAATKHPAGVSAGCIALWIGFLVLGCAIMGYHPREELQITCLDVGQGDGALVQMPDGINCLIDCGSSSESALWEYRISQAVKYYGISSLDYVFLSHADKDHISGIGEFLEKYERGFGGANVHGITLGTLVLPPTADETDFQEIRALAQANGITVLRMEAGDQVGMLTCLAPNREGLSGDTNQDSMVLMLQYGSFKMLFTGDMEGTAEVELCENAAALTMAERENANKEDYEAMAITGDILDADVLKVGHHGSRNGSSEKFLTQVSPEAAIISCGRNNSYGHPAEETLKRLADAGAHIFSTADYGAIQIRSDGQEFQVYTYLGKR